VISEKPSELVLINYVQYKKATPKTANVLQTFYAPTKRLKSANISNMPNMRCISAYICVYEVHV